MANPYALSRDASITAPTAFQVFHLEGAGSFTKYRWLFVTAIKNGRESAVSGIGDVHGNVDPNTAALACWTREGSPDKFRVYLFNCYSDTGLFDPQLNTTAAGMLAADGSTPICRFKEIPAPNNHGPWPPDTSDLTNELRFSGDEDGTNYWGGDEETLPTPGPTPTIPPTTVAEAVKCYYRASATSSSSHTAILGSTTSTITIPTSHLTNSLVPQLVVEDEFTEAELDALEFGVERGTSGGTVSLFACVCEVLHETDLDPIWEQPSTSYQHVVGTYVGNGAYQDIGVDFVPRAIMIKKLDGAAASANGMVAKLGRLGGTVSRTNGSGDPVADAIQNITATGFELGPNAAVNESGVTFVYVALQDGGNTAGGQYFTEQVYFRDESSNPRTISLVNLRQDIVSSWTPQFVLVMGASATVLKTDDFAADESLVLGTTTTLTGYLSGLSAGAIEVSDTGNILEGTLSVDDPLLILAWRNLDDDHDLKEEAVRWGKTPGTGAAQVVGSLPFVPEFIVADLSSIGTTGAVRHRTAGAGGTTSYEWSDSDPITTGIIDIDSDSFELASAYSVNGVDTYWFLFKDQISFDPDDTDTPPLPGGVVEYPGESPFPCGGSLCLSPPTLPGDACQEPRP